MEKYIANVTESVTDFNTAVALGSGDLPVYATPAMVALMEKASCKAIKALLNENETTVGTNISVNHLSATPIGLNVTATAELISREGRSFSFKVTASDESGIIGEGTHTRFLVFSDRFTEKTYSKLNK